MKIWLKRMGYTAVFLFWCVIMLLPTMLFFSLSDGQSVWGDDPNDQVRIFLMQEVGQEGVGVQWSRPATADEACIMTSVRYLMFDGEAENNDLCICTGTPASGNVPTGCEVRN
jgi:hypothetical protein